LKDSIECIVILSFLQQTPLFLRLMQAAEYASRGIQQTRRAIRQEEKRNGIAN
jgi:hypothetical protein